MENSQLIDKLNNALSWELRAINLYAHYSAYVQGIHRLQLAGHFTAEVTESIGHANIVRSAIVKLGERPQQKGTPIQFCTLQIILIC